MKPNGNASKPIGDANKPIDNANKPNDNAIKRKNSASFWNISSIKRNSDEPKQSTEPTILLLNFERSGSSLEVRANGGRKNESGEAV